MTIQRSKGYEVRRTLSVKQIGEAIACIKAVRPDVIVMVDNCYGEFVETLEPSDVGADMIVGSLIKNPGGGLAVPHDEPVLLSGLFHGPGCDRFGS